MQLKEALQLQLDVQRRLHEQLEVWLPNYCDSLCHVRKTLFLGPLQLSL